MGQGYWTNGENRIVAEGATDETALVGSVRAGAGGQNAQGRDRLMKLPRMPVTVRWLMIAVGLAAVVLGAFEAGRRWERSDDIQGIPTDLLPPAFERQELSPLPP